jgi:tetratricopeptide (TPR) repeat protein
MSEALYERYKEALRRGHVAAMRGHHAAAIEAYSEAARIAPDRALPLVSLGTVLTRLGKTSEALSTFDAALDRAPSDEGALRGRADVLLARGDRAAAAEALDRLALALDAAGRLPEATDAARQALELAESRSRRRLVTSMTERLRADDDPRAAAALDLALGVLEGRALDPADGLVARDAPADADPDADASMAGPEAVVDGASTAPAGEPPAPFDPAAATAQVEATAEAGDADATVTVALAAAAGHRAAGGVGAAIDACYLALGVSPTEPRLHLALAELYLDRGWRPLAVDKLVLLRRLAELIDDPATLEAVAEISASRLSDEPRLVSVGSD